MSLSCIVLQDITTCLAYKAKAAVTFLPVTNQEIGWEERPVGRKTLFQSINQQFLFSPRTVGGEMKTAGEMPGDRYAEDPLAWCNWGKLDPIGGSSPMRCLDILEL